MKQTKKNSFLSIFITIFSISLTSSLLPSYWLVFLLAFSWFNFYAMYSFTCKLKQIHDISAALISSHCDPCYTSLLMLHTYRSLYFVLLTVAIVGWNHCICWTGINMFHKQFPIQTRTGLSLSHDYSDFYKSQINIVSIFLEILEDFCYIRGGFYSFSNFTSWSK